MISAFVGREQELERASQLIDAARHGSEAVLSIEAGAGLGKTALARQVVARARDEGMEVLHASFVDGQELPPLWPWQRLLAKARSQVDSAVSRTVRDRILGDNDRLLESIDRGWEYVPELAALPGAVRSYRYFEWVERFFRQLAESTPILIVLEDLHNSDDASLRLLQFLIESLEYSALMFLLTWRPAEGRARHRVPAVIEKASYLLYSDAVSLGPLSPAETTQLLTQLTLGRVTIGEHDLVRWTGGVPLRTFFLSRRLDRREPTPVVRPEQIAHEFVASAMNELSAEARETATRFAATGNAVTTEEFRLITSEGAVPERIEDELTSCGLVIRDRAADGYRFFHDVIRQEIEERMRPEDRESLAATTARRLDSDPRTQDERKICLLRDLYLSARDAESLSRGRVYALRAVEIAQSKNDWPAAIDGITRLLAAESVELESDVRKNLEVDLCIAYRNDMREPFFVSRAVTLFRTLRSEGEIDRPARIAATFDFQTFNNALEFADELESLVGELPDDHPDKPMILVRMAQLVYLLRGEVGTARELLTTAARLAVNRNRVLDEVRIRAYAAYFEVTLRNFEKAVAATGDILIHDRECIDAETLETIFGATADALSGLGRAAEKQAHLVHMEELNRLYASPRLEYLFRRTRAEFALYAGDWSALPLGVPDQASFWSQLQTPVLAGAYLRGDIDGADRYQEEALAVSGGTGIHSSPFVQFTFCWAVGMRAYITGDDRWVGECASRLPQFFADRGHLPMFLCYVPITAARFSRLLPLDENEARQYYERLRESQNFYFEEEEYNIAGAKALLALSWQDHELAERHFEEAVAFSDKYEEKPWRAHYIFELALLTRPGEPDRAQRLLSEARREAERLHLRPLLDRIQREWDTAELAATSDETATAFTDPGDIADGADATLSAARITPRELEVLSCLAEGLTDKEIASFLNISPYTVGNHLRHIYEKTGSANRTEAVHWAVSRRAIRVEPEDG